MKKIFLIITILFIVTGCSEANKKNVIKEKSLLDEITLDDEDASYECSMYNKTNKNYDVAGKYAIYLDDKDNVTMISSKEIVESKDSNVLNQFESYYNSSYEKIANYGGYTYDIYQENDHVIANVIVDYNTFNMESYVQEYEDVAEYINEEYKITKDKIIEKYKNANITCQKK